MRGHKSFRSHKQGPTADKIISRGNYEMIELRQCEDDEMRIIEQEVMNEFKLFNVINKFAAYQTREDKHLRNIEMQRLRRHAIKPPREILYPTEEDRKKRKVERQRERRAEQRMKKQ
tara:strand:+ start:213 stop:563 length:351 start_codon:yes stop_codon:yes gene_type:complete